MLILSILPLNLDRFSGCAATRPIHLTSWKRSSWKIAKPRSNTPVLWLRSWIFGDYRAFWARKSPMANTATQSMLA
jgi:hypothetical protein